MENYLRPLMNWLPSIMVSLFFVKNTLEKILQPADAEKLVDNKGVMIMAGVFLLLATALFLYRKTLWVGAALLSLYMTLIVFIHLYKGKAFELTSLIVIGVIFAAYLRSPEFFHSKHPES